MKTLILIILTMNVFAFDNVSGNIVYYYDKVTRKIVNKPDRAQFTNTESIQLNFDKTCNDFYFNSSLFAYTYKTNTIEGLRSLNVYQDFKSTEIFFRSLYVSYKLTNNLSIGGGLLPFSNTTPVEFSRNYYADGEGISILNDSVLTGVFLNYNTDNTRTIAGIGTQDSILVPSGNYIDETLTKGTITSFLIHEYTTDKIKFTAEYLHVNMKYEGTYISTIDLLGLSLSYDDAMESGWSFYTQAGISRYENHAGNVKDKILKNNKIPSYVPVFKPNNFAFEDSTLYGKSVLLGFRKDFSLLNEEFFINAEFFRTFGDWTSGNQGNPYLGKRSNLMFNVRDNSYFLNLGYNFNKNIQARIYTTILELNEKGKVGATADTIPVDQYIGPQVYKITISGFSVSYLF